MQKITDISVQVFKANNIAFNSPAFLAFWNNGYTIVKEEDNGYILADLLGDTFCPIANPNIDPAQLKREKRQEIKRINEEGVFGVGLALNGEPIYETFIWGFVGDDFIKSGYDGDLIDLLATKI